MIFLHGCNTIIPSNIMSTHAWIWSNFQLIFRVGATETREVSSCIAFGCCDSWDSFNLEQFLSHFFSPCHGIMGEKQVSGSANNWVTSAIVPHWFVWFLWQLCPGSVLLKSHILINQRYPIGGWWVNKSSLYRWGNQDLNRFSNSGHNAEHGGVGAQTPRAWF